MKTFEELKREKDIMIRELTEIIIGMGSIGMCGIQKDKLISEVNTLRIESALLDKIIEGKI